VQNEELRRPSRPSWDEIASRAAKRSAGEKPESDKSKQKRWDKAGLNMHNISSTDPNYVHRNNPKFDPQKNSFEDDPKKKDESIELDTPNMVLEYFENYFGGTLNESTSDEEIMEAVYDLVALRDAVLEAVGFDTPIPNPLEKHDSVGGMRKGYRSDTWTAGQSIEKDKRAAQAGRKKNMRQELMKKYKQDKRNAIAKYKSQNPNMEH